MPSFIWGKIMRIDDCFIGVKDVVSVGVIEESEITLMMAPADVGYPFKQKQFLETKLRRSLTFLLHDKSSLNYYNTFSTSFDQLSAYVTALKLSRNDLLTLAASQAYSGAPSQAPVSRMRCAGQLSQ